MLVTVKQITTKAKKGDYGVGAFNAPNLEIAKAIVLAAEAMNSPVIISTSEKELNYAGVNEIAAIVRSLADNSKIPVALNLDHGSSFKMAKKCIESGYSSIHFDGSSLPLNENIKISKKIVAIAHKKGISVEGEIGHIGGASSLHSVKIDVDEDSLADPEVVMEFFRKTNVDVIAVAVGSAHGMYKTVPQLDFNRIRKIESLVKVPLVLHGGSGIPDKQIKKAIKLGMRKINVNTELRIAFSKTLRKTLAIKKQEVVPYNILPPSVEAVKKVVEEKIKLFGSKNKA
ncbi:class II fructose-bisphosphate aldolase [bacterium]|nr:class II fructose-bisphosphate aldolase [bacterium]